VARIALVSCGKAKRATACKAKDLYTSVLFKWARKYAERFADRWYILSAKHGLLDPGMVVAPYAQNLKHMTAAERMQWAAGVRAALSLLVEPGDELVVLAGRAYASAVDIPGVRVMHPLTGTFGVRMQYMKRAVQGGRP
jgi:hypothetical protein